MPQLISLSSAILLGYNSSQEILPSPMSFLVKDNADIRSSMQCSAVRIYLKNILSVTY